MEFFQYIGIFIFNFGKIVGQGFSSGNWEEALAFQIGNFMRDNCSFWEDRVFKSFWNRVFFIVQKY